MVEEEDVVVASPGFFPASMLDLSVLVPAVVESPSQPALIPASQPADALLPASRPCVFLLCRRLSVLEKQYCRE